MKSVVDRFGTKVQTRITDCGHFIATVDVSVSPTFFAWVFSFGGKMKILAPIEIRNEYIQMLKDAQTS